MNSFYHALALISTVIGTVVSVHLSMTVCVQRVLLCHAGYSITVLRYQTTQCFCKCHRGL